MSDIERIVWGAFGGILVYVAGQLLSKFLIEPLYELRKSVGEVRFNLAFHASTIHTPIGRTKETSDAAGEALLKDSCNLIANLQAVPLYELIRLLSFGVLMEKVDFEKAAVELRGLSTYMHEKGAEAYASIDEIRNRVNKIEKLLQIKPLE